MPTPRNDNNPKISHLKAKPMTDEQINDAAKRMVIEGEEMPDNPAHAFGNILVRAGFEITQQTVDVLEAWGKICEVRGYKFTGVVVEDYLTALHEVAHMGKAVAIFSTGKLKIYVDMEALGQHE